ncbi:MAG: methyltransferase domain-containing protein [Candidatus Shapirobacteria bacterium]|jgi:SAM-dependent methyltransferase
MKSDHLISSSEAGFGKRLRDIELWGDKEGQIVTNYQEISEYIARRIFSKTGDKSILEICCGIGSLTVFLAKVFSRVIAVDINPIRIVAANKNLQLNNLINRVDLITGDIENEKVINKICNKYKIGAVCTDVTWSETGIYGQDHTDDLDKTTPATDKLFKLLTDRDWKNICMRLPKTIDYKQLMGLGSVEIEEISINGELKFIYAYFGMLVKDIGITKKNFRIDRK